MTLVRQVVMQSPGKTHVPVFKGTPRSTSKRKCPYMTGVLHDRFLNMGEIGHRSEKTSPDHRVVLPSECPLKTGFTVK